MWKRVDIYGHKFFAYIRGGQITQVRSGTEQFTADKFQSMYPDLFKTIGQKVNGTNIELEVLEPNGNPS